MTTATNVLVSQSNRQGRKGSEQALGEIAEAYRSEQVSVPSPYDITGLRTVTRKDKTVIYSPALKMAHAAYLHINLGYPVGKALSLANQYSDVEGTDILVSYYGKGTDANVREAINSHHAVTIQNRKDTELDRAYAALEAAKARLEKLGVLVSA